MCQKCGQNCNGGCEGGSMQEQLSDLQNQLTELQVATKFLTCGHGIFEIEDANDVGQFDLVTGKGFGCWEGFGICNGTSYPNKTNTLNIATPNLLDKFIVGALGSYAVGATGGANSVSLAVSEMPAHAHTVTDPGHNHQLTDLGHTHGVFDPGHTHAFTGAPHIHTGQAQLNGDHNHQYAGVLDAIQNGGTGQFAPADPVVDNNTSVNGAHTHTLTIDPATAGGTNTSSPAGVSTQSSFTGITVQNHTAGITVNSNGGGAAHENRPPFYALIFVKKIF